VFADDGSELQDISLETSKQVASMFLRVPEGKLQHAMLTEVDQWTVGQIELPLHKITADDGDKTVLYISPRNGQIVQMTTRGSRALAWVAAIPHWFYFKSLRTNRSLWYYTVVWTSALGCVLALAGIVLSFSQLKVSRPFKWRQWPSYIPYTGWMRWHFITGAIFGIFTFTWVFSGLLSMEPMGWAAGPPLQGDLQGVLSGGPIDVAEFPDIDPQSWLGLIEGRALKEIEYTRIQGVPHYIAMAPPPGASSMGNDYEEYPSHSGVDPGRVLINAETMQIVTEPFSVESVMARVKEAFPDVPILESELLTNYDSYYYSRDRQETLPVLRVKFGDEVSTWTYIDPRLSRELGSIHRLDRVERWIYNGLHSLDFGFWYYSPLWTVGVIILSLGGAAVSSLGMLVGFRRLGRGFRRLARS
jgi:hypothetical protein